MTPKYEIVEPAVVNELASEFFELLPFQKVRRGDVSKSDIDRGQTIAETLVGLRISLNGEFTPEELEGMTHRKLVQIATSFNLKTEDVELEKLIGKLVGKPKSMRPSRQITAVFKRLKESRSAIGYLHESMQV